MSVPQRAAELYAEIERLIGPPRPYDRESQKNPRSDTEVRLLRQWLIAKGVPEAAAYRASTYVLNGAWNGQDRYIRPMIEEATTKTASRRRTSAAIDIGDAFAPSEIDQHLGVPKSRPVAPDSRETKSSIFDDSAADDLEREITQRLSARFEAQRQDDLRRIKSLSEALSCRESEVELAETEARRQAEAAIADNQKKIAAATEALRATALLLEADETIAPSTREEAAGALRQSANLLEGRETAIEGPKSEAPAISTEPQIPDTRTIAARDLFGNAIGDGLLVPRFAERTEFVPAIDPDYVFDPETTFSILLGFTANRRVLISGKHGTGKTSHVEQVAARLNWPFVRLNLDGHISRTDLIGRDAIVIESGLQKTAFKEGILPWSMQQPMALCLDEYDAGRPDVLFVVQRLLEADGRLTIAEQNRVIEPHEAFRLFATANTVGLGDSSGLYHGTNPLNAAQMDRWSIVVKLDYLPAEHECRIIKSKCPTLRDDTIASMVNVASAVRKLFAAGKISTVMSPRTVIIWAENAGLMHNDLRRAFTMTFLNKCDETEQPDILSCFDTAFGRRP